MWVEIIFRAAPLTLSHFYSSLMNIIFTYVNAGDDEYDPLFLYGLGLSY